MVGLWKKSFQPLCETILKALWLTLQVTSILTFKIVYNETLNLLIKLFESKDGEVIPPTPEPNCFSLSTPQFHISFHSIGPATNSAGDLCPSYLHMNKQMSKKSSKGSWGEFWSKSSCCWGLRQSLTEPRYTSDFCAAKDDLEFLFAGLHLPIPALLANTATAGLCAVGGLHPEFCARLGKHSTSQLTSPGPCCC